jgi:RNA polymerase sigma-70 factor, ECF subfamily
VDQPTDLKSIADRVFREESGRIVASLIRISGSFDLAEEAMQEAFAAALVHWPARGVPEKPGAWIMAVAHRKLIDGVRRSTTRTEKQDALTHETQRASPSRDEADSAAVANEMPSDYPDDRLRLMFTCCHPALNREAQVGLTLRTLGGLTTTEIARAFLVPEKTLGQRIVRAKRTLSEARVPFETPRGSELAERVESVLAVIYLIFNEGYTATSGDEWMRPALSDEALRLGRMLAELLPGETEVHGLLALMELQASRAAARRGRNGEAVLLMDQDRSRWNVAQIQRGFAALARAQHLGGGARNYALQAAIAACHARATVADDTDWEAIVVLYDALLQIRPTPVVALNRAVAVAMVHGPAAGLDALDPVANDPSMAGYALLPSVRGDLLMRLGRFTEARDEIRRAISLTKNRREQDILAEKLGRMPA